MKLLYHIAVYFYKCAVLTASFFNDKAKKWIDGRKNILPQLEEKFSERKYGSGKLIWFHCASLGEFEQARPLIERIKSFEKETQVLISFFSPSGYEIRKNYSLADFVLYLPLDTKKNAERFIKAIKPDAAVFVKYEFWFHFLNELNRRKIPVFLISASFRREQHFFTWYGGWFRKMLKMFTHIFVQDEKSKNLLDSFQISATVSGDTRFDRVYDTVRAAEKIALMEEFRKDKKIFICGSTWPADEQAITAFPFWHYNLKIIIAPHEITEARIKSVLQIFPSRKTLRFSQADERNIAEAEVLIIDNIGMLSRLYRYGSIAYIGGGFGKSLHNILEAAAFGLPVIFGPNHYRFWEAGALIDKGGAFSISTSEELGNRMNFLLNDEMILKIASEMSRNFVRSNTGATGKILEKLKMYKLIA